MRTKHILLSILAATLTWETVRAATKPNILFLNTDQWRASATGYAGDPNVKTPHLDRLAKEALNFRNAVSVLPVCTPYRAALLTGRYPTTTGMFLNDLHLPEAELCMAEIFNTAGYDTGYIGKWHLDGNGRESYIPPERRQGWKYWKAAECDHNYHRSHYYSGTNRTKQYWEGYDTYAQTKDAAQFLRDRAKTAQPFVLMLSYGTPHFPHETAPKELQALYPPEKIILPPSVPAKLADQARKEAQGYYAHCTALDQCIGDLLQTLADTGLASNTIVVFSSDHGESLGCHGVPPKQKQVPWNESAGIPFLLRVPGVAPRTVHTPITTPDVLPTLLSLCGLTVPDSVEGEDLSPIIKSGQDADRAALYMAVAPFIKSSPQHNTPYRAIRTDRYTYARNLKGPWLLYDNANDPYSTNNLAQRPEQQALVEKLDARLQAELKRTRDDFRAPEEYLKAWNYRVGPDGSIPYVGGSAQQTPRRSTE
jgi:arylsulfatase A-like enzyme